MTIKILAADSKLHIRQKQGQQPFRGMIGVIIQSNDPSIFKNSYDKILNSFFKDNGLEQEKKVYKSYDIASLLPGPKWRLRGALRRLVIGLLQIPETEITVHFCTLDLEALRVRKIETMQPDQKTIEMEKLRYEGVESQIIQIYGEPGNEPVEYISVESFFEKISQYFQ